MKFNLATVLALLVGLASLLAQYATGFLQSHPDVSAVLQAVVTVLVGWLPALKKSAEVEL